MLQWLKEPGQTDAQRTNYTYDNLYRTTGVSQDGASTSYAYTNDLLTSLAAPSGPTRPTPGTTALRWGNTGDGSLC